MLTFSERKTLYQMSRIHQEYFGALDNREYDTPSKSNVKYLEVQLSEYRTAIEKGEGTPEEDALNPLYNVFAKSEMSRILAIILRECIIHGWDFDEVLSEGVEYEDSVILDIKEGRRPVRSHRGYSG